MSLDDASQPLTRIPGLQVLALAGFLLLLAFLIRIQIFEGSYYRDLANGNRLREVVIHAPRGIIYDRNDIPLVVNLPAFRLRTKSSVSTISKNQAIALEAGGLETDQSLEIDSVRSYPFGKTTAHILGYVSEITADELPKRNGYSPGDKIGRGGVEETYESRLRGRDGKELIEVDALGKKLRTLSIVPPVPGENLHLSIDINLQKAAYGLIKDHKAAAVAADPATGAILALTSSPSFDPNAFTDLNLSETDRENAISAIFKNSDQPLFDRAISGTYPPGSTFKIVTASAGLETGKINEQFQITDPGILVIGPYKFPNWKYLQDGGTQGDLNVVSALQKSNDIFFYTVGGLVGVDDLGHWAEKFGLNKPLGIDLPGESAGLFPDATWRNAHARDWYLGDTYHLAIGQGDLLVTPLQDNSWTNVIASGGKLCRPRVLLDDPVSCIVVGLSPTTLNLVHAGLVAACSPGGTAYPLFGFQSKKQPIQIACKTGTAEFGDLAADRTHAWLTAFAPAEKPQISTTVIFEAGGEGSDIAAPAVKQILSAWFSR